MYGATKTDLAVLAAILLFAGAVLGKGCELGCAFVRAHVEVK